MREAIENVRNGFRDVLTLWWAVVSIVILSFIRADPRAIRDVPLGFDEQDVNMTYTTSLWNHSKVAKFLAPSPQNLERSYQIGIAFVGRGNRSLGRGHAEIVIRDGDNLSEIGPPRNLDLTISPSIVDPNELIRAGPYKLTRTDNIRLRVLHLRNANDGGNSLELALEGRPKVAHYRYADLYRIRTTERQLKHLALISCPREYTILVDDCATFCRTFLEKLLDHLLSRGKHNGGIDGEQHRHQKRLLRQQIHIEDGLAGELEWRAASPARSESSINGTSDSIYRD